MDDNIDCLGVFFCSFLLGQSGVKRCLATAILHGDCQLKQSSLALVGTLGFSADSVVGLSQSLDQLSPAAKPCASDVPSKLKSFCFLQASLPK